RGSESRVRLSVPFLLLDGSVDVIPLPGAGATVGGEGTALIVPLSHRMMDRAAFERVKASEQLQVQTMDLCPKRIRLIYRNREFLGRIEVRSASLCPVNELNRVEFEAKEGEVKEILEASALHPESVQVIADLESQQRKFRKVSELQLEAQFLQKALLQEFYLTQPSSMGSWGKKLFSLESIGEGWNRTFRRIFKEQAVSLPPESEIQRSLQEYVDRFFDPITSCRGGGLCRALREQESVFDAVQLRWAEADPDQTQIKVQQSALLGPVAQSSAFLSLPSQLTQLRAIRPEEFEPLSELDILTRCLQVNLNPLLSHLSAYCELYLALHQSEDRDGYFPFGVNTTVFPGAWLKIDLEEISE
ncbi:hypothetical protein EBZ37_14610, partial [bacterium]|nr:hypothetical protein [bacterium]